MDLNGSAESQGDLVRTLETMVRIRAFENKLGAMFKKGQLPGFVHLSVGQEATAVGTCSELRPDDTVSTTHRGHGHMIAKGADLRRMMAEILGRTDGYCKGMGGSMHLMDLELGIIGANGIVGAGIASAPRSSSISMSSPACSIERVTTIRFPKSGRSSNQRRCCRSPATAPTTSNAATPSR